MAEQPGDELVGRLVIDIGGTAGLKNPAAGAEDLDPVGHEHRLLGIVGDHECGGAGVFEHHRGLLPDLHAQIDVEAGERLVQQQQPGPGRQRPGQRHALLLAAR